MSAWEILKFLFEYRKYVYLSIFAIRFLFFDDMFLKYVANFLFVITGSLTNIYYTNRFMLLIFTAGTIGLITEIGWYTLIILVAFGLIIRVTQFSPRDRDNYIITERKDDMI